MKALGVFIILSFSSEAEPRHVETNDGAKTNITTKRTRIKQYRREVCGWVIFAGRSVAFLNIDILQAGAEIKARATLMIRSRLVSRSHSVQHRKGQPWQTSMIEKVFRGHILLTRSGSIYLLGIKSKEVC